MRRISNLVTLTWAVLLSGTVIADPSSPAVQTGNGDGVSLSIATEFTESWRIDSSQTEEEPTPYPTGLEPVAAKIDACLVATDDGAPGRNLDVELIYTDNFDYGRICSATWVTRQADDSRIAYEDVVCDYLSVDGIPSARASLTLTDSGIADLDGVENNNICFSMTPMSPTDADPDPEDFQNGVALTIQPLDIDKWQIDSVLSAAETEPLPTGLVPLAAKTQACLSATDEGVVGRSLDVALTYVDDFNYDYICDASWIARSDDGSPLLVEDVMCDYSIVNGLAGARAFLTLEDGGVIDQDTATDNNVCFAMTPTFSDSDGDTLFDDVDSCPNTPVDEVGDIDEDGCGPSERDSDGDGITDGDDFCPSTAPEELEFVESDGCSPNERDTDGDGIIDLNDAFPTNPNETQDSDGDGFGDNEEVASGTDPLDAEDFPVKRKCPVYLMSQN